MKTVFIAGPKPGTPENDGVYTRTQTRLEKAGYEVLNPQAIRTYNTRLTPQEALRFDAALLARADIVCALDLGGARPAIRMANAIGIPVRTPDQIFNAGAKP